LKSLGGATVSALQAAAAMHLRTAAFLLIAPSACSSPDDVSPDAGTTTTLDAPAGAPTKKALVELRLQPPLFQNDSPELEISGGFIVSRDPRCQRTTAGGCEVSNCPQALIGNDYADPGKLTFSPSGGVIAFTPGPSFLSFRANAVPWAANETITLSSAGSDVPPFTAAVASPRTLDAGEGRTPFGPPLVRSQPFTATWIPTGEQVQVLLRQGRDTANGPFEIVVACHVSGTSGSATVPAAALASFIPKSSGGLSVDVTAHAFRETVVEAGDFAVTYRVLRSFDETFFHDVQ
jgi:hypothetical protein